MLNHPRLVKASLLTAFALCLVLGSAIAGYPALYRQRIYPGVSVRGVELGNRTIEEATALLARRLSPPAAHAVTLRGVGKTWALDWRAVGSGWDWAITAEDAYQVARRGPWHERLMEAWTARVRGERLEPRLRPADPDRVRASVDKIAPEVYHEPTDAALLIDPGGVTCVPGESGRALDRETTTDSVMAAIDEGVPDVQLVTVSLPPEIARAEPGCSQARSLLSQPFTLVIDDPLTDYRVERQAGPDLIAHWLRVTTVEDRILLDVDDAPIKSWLGQIGRELGAERILDVDETLERTVAALQAGGHQARSAIRHPPSTYVVQPGDTLFDIAYNHGFPQWRLEEANPDVEPDELLIGMELTIPSIDVLFPEPLVPGKRIEIDLPEQRLRAYEEEELAFDFTCSSGMTSTPTIAGQFQVLYKEPEAFAQRWSLTMPYFMAIYYEGPGFTNGIHELPTRSNGERLWASVLGWPASYGCIILDVGDAEKLYNWAPVGTLIRIEGVAPGTPRYVPTYDDESVEG